jgi:hypothetical protein
MSGPKSLSEAREAGTGTKVRIRLWEHEWSACGTATRLALFDTSYANRSQRMKKRLCLVSALAGITILHCPALAETAKPNSTAPPAAISPPPNGQSSKKAAKDCDEEWRADRKFMMEHDMTEDSYVDQCTAANDVPVIPSETKTNTAPSPVSK